MTRLCAVGHDLEAVGEAWSKGDNKGRCRQCRRDSNRRTEQRPERKARCRKPQNVDLRWVLQRVQVVDGCWRWTGLIKVDGYGATGGATAHRVIYEALVGRIDNDLTIDHICHAPDCRLGTACLHRRCVNPRHLKPASRLENCARTGNATKTHCLRGHPYTAENTGFQSDGRRRYCRQCLRDRRAVKRADLLRVEDQAVA